MIFKKLIFRIRINPNFRLKDISLFIYSYLLYKIFKINRKTDALLKQEINFKKNILIICLFIFKNLIKLEKEIKQLKKLKNNRKKFV